MNSRLRTLAMAAVASSVVIGCNGGSGAADSETVVTGTTGGMGGVATAGGAAPAGGMTAGRAGGGSASDLKLAGLPGLPVQQIQDPGAIFKSEERVVASRYGGARPDPFALKAPEKAFEIEQNTNRLLGTMGSWTVIYTPEPEKAPTDGLIADPQPYRRLSGIIVGDSVYALLDNGDGSPVIIRPGTKVPNTEWTVVSIDTEKAILRRPGNKTPRQITVRLESPPAGMGGNQGGNPGFQGGTPAGGAGMPGRRGPGGSPGNTPGAGGSGPGTGSAG